MLGWGPGVQVKAACLSRRSSRFVTCSGIHSANNCRVAPHREVVLLTELRSEGQPHHLSLCAHIVCDSCIHLFVYKRIHLFIRLFINAYIKE